MVAVRVNTIAVRVRVRIAVRLTELAVQLTHQAGGERAAVRLRTAAAARLVRTEAAQTVLTTVAAVLGQPLAVVAVSLVKSRVQAVQVVQVVVDEVEQTAGAVQHGRLTLLLSGRLRIARL